MFFFQIVTKDYFLGLISAFLLHVFQPKALRFRLWSIDYKQILSNNLS